MNTCGSHCPFLNRADQRCSTYFSLDRLTHAYEHCFDAYQACPIYLELLTERRVRRLQAGATAAAAAPAGGTAYAPAAHVVQLTVAHRHV